MSAIIKPLPGYAVLRKREQEEVKVGSFALPEDATRRPDIGEVVRVSKETEPDKPLVLPDIKAGDFVAYKRYEVFEIKVDGKEYILAPFAALMGVIEYA